jgi:hypothetical protein
VVLLPEGLRHLDVVWFAIGCEGELVNDGDVSSFRGACCCASAAEQEVSNATRIIIYRVFIDLTRARSVTADESKMCSQ